MRAVGLGRSSADFGAPTAVNGKAGDRADHPVLFGALGACKAVELVALWVPPAGWPATCAALYLGWLTDCLAAGYIAADRPLRATPELAAWRMSPQVSELIGNALVGQPQRLTAMFA